MNNNNFIWNFWEYQNLSISIIRSFQHEVYTILEMQVYRNYCELYFNCFWDKNNFVGLWGGNVSLCGYIFVRNLIVFNFLEIWLSTFNLCNLYLAMCLCEFVFNIRWENKLN